MNTNPKFLIINSRRTASNFISFLARSCFAAFLLHSTLFISPVAAQKPAESNFGNIFFPQRPFPASMDDAYKTMLALAVGRLVLKNGCLRLKASYAKESFLLIWPGRYEFKVKNQVITIKDVYLGVEPEVRIKLNSKVMITGGGMPDHDPGALIFPLPESCKGPYWSVGGIELESKGKGDQRKSKDRVYVN